MKLQDLDVLFPSAQLEIIVNNSRQFTVGTDVRLRGIEDSTAVYINKILDSKDGNIVLQDIDAEFATKHYSELWAQIQNCYYRAQISAVNSDRLMIYVLYGFMEKKFSTPLELAVTDKQVKTDNKFPLRNVSAVKDHIRSDYVFKVGSTECICVAKNRNGKDDTFMLVNGAHCYTVKQFTRRELGVVSMPKKASDDSINDDATDDPNEIGDMIWTINSGERPFVGNLDYSYELWECVLELADETTAEKQRKSTTAFINQGLERYLAVWQQYTEIEYHIMSQLVKRAGKLNYSTVQHISGTKRYQLTIINPQLLPEFDSCIKELGKEAHVDVSVLYKDKRGNEKEGTSIATFRHEADMENTVEVELEEVPKIGGKIQISPVLAKKQYDRRTWALTRISTAKSAKPDLAMLISGELTNTSNKNIIGAREHKSPFSQSVLKCFHGNTPTPAQRAAVSIAINTPDFAIIQGPPGTGKTTVINAIMRALAEKEKDPDLAYGQNLLTAYQRDTTSHLAEKLHVYGLPVPTYCGTSGTNDENIRNASIDEWIIKKRKELQQHNWDVTDLEPSERLTDQVALLNFHFNSEVATIAEAQSVLEALALSIDECSAAERQNYKNRLNSMQNILSLDELLYSGHAPSLRAPIQFHMHREEVKKLLQEANYKLDSELHTMDRWYASRLPDTDVAMSDDGNAVRRSILDRFHSPLYPERVQKIAKDLDALYDSTPIPFEKIRPRKDLLIVSVAGTRYPVVDVDFNQRVAQLLVGITDLLKQVSTTDEQKVLADYHNAFDVDNDELLREWLSEFMTVIAATHQKAVSVEVMKHKETESQSEAVYENVLIDEAARSCPPDLLIPMACARKRMILAGDQNQLPQFISETVYEKIDGYEKSELDELVREPMFLRLIKQVAKLEEKDHVQRFIQLDEQYRMPQTLGDIISKYFYESEEERKLPERKIKSPLGNDENHTVDDLPLISGKHLVWLDVSSGRQAVSENKSLFNQQEIDEIVKMLKGMIKNADTPERYQYAIITFYSEQRDRMREAIDNDPFLSAWDPNEERIKVGTVDAFQGMEADVVFLSLVRSLPKYSRKKNLYGFVSNANRQCVALSRAKRCLIIAGNKDMVSGSRKNEAYEFMPAIAAIYETCSGGGVQDACVIKTSKGSGTSSLRN